MKYIKQYGIQRSGTNFMRAVFEMNLDCRVLSNIGGAKHSRVTNNSIPGQIKSEIPIERIREIDKMLKSGEIPRIVIIKNPYAWIPSISKYLNKPITNDFIEEQLARYIDLNTHWADNCDYVIYYEELLSGTEDIINDCSRVLGIKRITNEIIMPNGVMKRGGDIEAVKNISNQPFDASYVHEKKYMYKLTPEQVDYISSMVPSMNFLNLPLIK